MNYTKENLSSPSPITNQSVLSRIFKRYIPKWRFFILALIIALVCAYIYSKVAKNVYEVKATLVIKDKDKVDQDKTDLQELDMANPAKKVEIELEVFKSRKLIAKVINDLKIWANYEIAGKKQLYKSSPVIYQPVGTIPYGTHQFDIRIIDQNNFEITNNNKKTNVPFNKIFKSDYGLAIIQSAANLKQHIGETVKITLQDNDAVIKIYQDAYEARLVDKLQPVIELSMRDENVDRGKDFLNYIIAEYNSGNTEEKNKLTKNTLAFIDKRLDSLSRDLTHVEKNIEGYKSSRGLTDISAESEAYIQSMQSNNLRLNDANVQLKVIDGIEKYVNSPGSNNVPSTIGIEDKGLVNLVDQLAKLQLERTKLLATTPETNYLFDPINQQIGSTVTAIKSNVKNIKSSLLNIKNGLQSFGSQVESSIKDLPGQERGYISIKRQQGIKENLYTYLLQKREQVALSYASTLTDVNVIDKAYVDTIVWPKKSVIYALAIILALGLTTITVFLLDLFHNKINTVEEIEENLGTPVLNEFIDAKTNSPIVVLDQDQSVITQQFRALRTSLNYMQGNKEKGRVIGILSGKSTEGKTFVASNLALSMAASGRKTIIIDFNLRKPDLANIFGLTNKHAGISNFLNDEASIEDLIQPSKAMDHLDIITSGDKAPNPSELIENKSLGKLINTLKDKYDEIILDTPSLYQVTDAYIISQYSDVSLYTIRKGVTKKSELNFIKKLYHEQRLPKLNLIFNGAPKSSQNVGY